MCGGGGDRRGAVAMNMRVVVTLSLRLAFESMEGGGRQTSPSTRRRGGGQAVIRQALPFERKTEG